MNMERERKLGLRTRNRDSLNHQYAASSEVKVENEETSLSLSQWLHPSKLPHSYLALLNEDSTLDEKPSHGYVVENVVLPCRNAGTGAGRGIRTVYSASESGRNCSEAIGNSKVKPSIRVQSCTNNDISGSSSKITVAGDSSRKSTYPLTQNYSEKLRSFKECSNKNNNNRDFSQFHGKHRDVPSKQFNKNQKRAYSTECERKQRIEDNIKALGELLPDEVEDNSESILNDVIAHVKLLQLQMKELSRSRLGGEPISHPLISIEGYGHYIHHEQMMTQPLEEIMAELLENDHDVAATLLESKGLYLMPLSSV